jgi:hypothetical protein
LPRVIFNLSPLVIQQPVRATRSESIDDAAAEIPTPRQVAPPMQTLEVGIRCTRGIEPSLDSPLSRPEARAVSREDLQTLPLPRVVAHTPHEYQKLAELSCYKSRWSEGYPGISKNAGICSMLLYVCCTVGGITIAEAKKMSRTQALRMARDLIAWYVQDLGLPHPKAVDCHECAERKAKTYAMYVYPVCEHCRKALAFVLGDISAIANMAPKLKRDRQLAAGISVASKMLQEHAGSPMEGEYLEEEH